MKVEPRPILFALIWGSSFVLVALFLALSFPDFLPLLFPASLVWLFLPFVALYLRRRFLARREA